MSTSTVKLYVDFPFTQEENKVIENIDDYLETLDYTKITDFQYIRNDELLFSVKFDMNQDNMSFIRDNNINYISIENDNQTIKYFYVIRKIWKAQSTIQYDLSLDTINTFEFGVDYELTNRTKVVREHKDRWDGSAIDTKSYTISDTCDHVEYINGIVWGYKDITYIETDVISRFEWTAFNYPIPKLIDLVTNRITVRVYGDTPNVGLGDSCHAMITLYFGGYQRKIDYYSEGIVTELVKDKEEELVDINSSTNWNLVYKSHTDDAEDDPTDLNNPVDLMLIPDEPVKVTLPASVPEYTYSDFTDGQYYLITGHTPLLDVMDASYYTEEHFTYDTTNTYTITPSFESVSQYNFIARWFYIRRSGTTLTLTECNQEFSALVLSTPIKNKKSQTARTITSIKIPEDSSGLWVKEVASTTDDYRNIRASQYHEGNQFPIPSWVTYDLAPITSVDREDPRILKIINLPYAPFNVKQGGNGILVPEGFEYDNGVLIAQNKPYVLVGEILSNTDTPLKELFGQNLNLNVNATRSKSNESKLYHSDFYLPKFVYCENSFSFKLENIKEDSISISSGIPKFTFNYATATSGSSKGYFGFSGFEWKLSKEDYDKHLTTNRSNELPLYSNQYLNYLRTGYNYDVRQRDRQIGAAVWNLGLGMVKSTKGGIENNDYGTFLTGMADSSIKAARQVATVWDNFQHKIDMTKMQAVSVSGSDDLPLFKLISNNHAKLVTYKANERIENLMFDLFYFYGYLTQEFKIPSIDTRYWFNFLQCEPDIDGINSNLSKAILDDISARLTDGVTFFHERSGTYELSQEKENWEVSLL